MKNWLKKNWLLLFGIIVVLVVVSLLVYAICKFGYDNVASQITYQLSQPVPIIGVSLYAVIMVFLFIFSKTSYGKRAINTLKGAVDKSNQALNKAKKDAELMKEQLVEARVALDDYKQAFKEEKEQLVETYNVYIDSCKQEIKKNNDFIIEIAKEINNVKIQEKVNAYIEETKNVVVEDVSNTIIEAKEEARSEVKCEIADLRHEIDDLKQLLETTKVDTEHDIKSAINETLESANEIKEELGNE